VTGTPSLSPGARAGFELESFEEVRATPTTSLLRLTGRWRGVARPPAAPSLIIAASGRHEALAPLAGPPPEADRLWRAGYAIPPSALATPGVALFLDAGERESLPLPLPSRVRAPSIETPRARPGVQPPARQRGAAVSIRLSDEDHREREKVERLTRELERAQREVERLAALEAKLLKSEAALTAAEAQIETLRAQLQEARAHAAELAARRRG
jgi:hypothetical protein